jgi:hypothetical protein
VLESAQRKPLQPLSVAFRWARHTNRACDVSPDASLNGVAKTQRTDGRAHSGRQGERGWQETCRWTNNGTGWCMFPSTDADDTLLLRKWLRLVSSDSSISSNIPVSGEESFVKIQERLMSSNESISLTFGLRHTHTHRLSSYVFLTLYNEGRKPSGPVHVAYFLGGRQPDQVIVTQQCEPLCWDTWATMTSDHISAATT